MVEYSRLTPEVREQLLGVIDTLAPRFDRILLDTGAGISDVVLYAVSLAGDVVLVVTPEPTSMTDAYATVKVLASQQQRGADPARRQPGRATSARGARCALSCNACRPLRQPRDRPCRRSSSTCWATFRSTRRCARRCRSASCCSRSTRVRRSGGSRRVGRPARAMTNAAARTLRRSTRPRPRLRPQQHDQRAAAALGRARLREGEHDAFCSQPAVHPVLEHRLASRRTVALAVHHAHAAQALSCGFAQEGGELFARLVAVASRAGRSAPGSPSRRGAACARRRVRCRVGETTARRRFRAVSRRRSRRTASRAAQPPRRAGAAAARARGAQRAARVRPLCGSGVTGPTLLREQLARLALALALGALPAPRARRLRAGGAAARALSSPSVAQAAVA